MARAHYHVGYNMPGYMPDPDSVHTVGSKRQAAASIMSDVEAYQDMDCIEHGYDHKPYHKAGRAKDGDVWLTPRECIGGSDFHFWYQACVCDEGAHELTCPNDWHGSHCDK